MMGTTTPRWCSAGRPPAAARPLPVLLGLALAGLVAAAAPTGAAADDDGFPARVRVALGDLTGDGRSERVVAVDPGWIGDVRPWSFFVYGPDRRLLAVAPLPDQDDLRTFVIRDLDGDGRAELLIEGASNGSAGGGVFDLWRLRDGALERTDRLEYGRWAGLFDVDLDGRDELVVGAWLPSSGDFPWNAIVVTFETVYEVRAGRFVRSPRRYPRFYGGVLADSLVEIAAAVAPSLFRRGAWKSAPEARRYLGRVHAERAFAALRELLGASR